MAWKAISTAKAQASILAASANKWLVYVGGAVSALDPAGGVLADVAPTLLDLMGLTPPAEMTGRSLVAAA